MSAGKCSAQSGAGQLQQLHATGLQLATRSLQLLSLKDPKEQQAFAVTNKDTDSSSSSSGGLLSYITCMGVIPKTPDEVRDEEGRTASVAVHAAHRQG